MAKTKVMASKHFTVRTASTNSSRIVRDAFSFRAALREASGIAKIYGQSLVTRGGRSLAYCHRTTKARKGPSQGVHRDAMTAFANCTLTDQGKKLLKQKRKRSR